MNGIKTFLLRVIPITILIMVVLTGLTSILVYGGDYTYLETKIINGQTFVYLNWQQYINGLDISNVKTTFSIISPIEINEQYKQAVGQFNSIKDVINTLIMILNNIIWIINLLLFPVKFIGIIAYYIMSLLGFKMNQDIAWDQFPIGAFINLVRTLEIPYINYV